MKENMKLLNDIAIDDIEKELNREMYWFRYKKMLTSTIFVLVIVISLSIMISTFVFPVLKIYGESMNSTLLSGDIVLCVKKNKFEQGNVIAFYYNNKVLVKRVVGESSDWINIDTLGNVFVNGVLLDEDYVLNKSYEDSDIEYPYQVSERSYFVLGDKRDTSIDSRNSLIGSIRKEDIIGEVVFRLWPLNRFGMI